MDLQFSPRAYSREDGLPDARLVNMFLEATPAGPSQSKRSSRPGLQSALNVGTGPNRGLFRQANVFNGDLFVASGKAIYRAGVNIGTTGGTDLVRSATSATERVFVANKKSYLYDGSSFSRIDAAPAAIDVIFTNGRHIYLQSGSGRFSYSEVSDAGNIDSLNFEDAELRPDPLVGGLVSGDTFQLFGTDSIEAWQATGDLTTPFERVSGRSFDRGCASRDTIKLVDNTAFWLGDDRMVYRAAYTPIRISTHSVEDKLRQCADIASVAGWDVTFEGHPWYGLNIPDVGTEVFDVSTSEWSSWESYGHFAAVFRGATVLQDDGALYVGDDTTDDIWTLSRNVFQDGGLPLVRVASAFVPVASGHPRCNRLSVACAKGVGNASQAHPVVEMRYSDDQGETWSFWRQGSPGEVGQYGQKLYWNRLGRMTSPGRAFELRCSDPVLATFATIELNGGRA